MTWVTENMLNSTFIGQNQQAFAIMIESSGRVKIFFTNKLGQATMFIVFTELADHAIGFIKQNQGHGFVPGLWFCYGFWHVIVAPGQNFMFCLYCVLGKKIPHQK